MTSQTLPVVINGDTANEPDETFTVRLTSAVGAMLIDDVATGTIRGDDAAPKLTVSDLTMLEGSAPGTATLLVQLSKTSPQVVTVRYATSDGTANAGSDYQSKSGTLTFQPGVTQQSLTLTVLGDTTSESDETFTVNLTNPTGAVLQDAIGEVSLLDDDSAGAVVSKSFQDGVSPTVSYAGTRDTRLRSSSPSSNLGSNSSLVADGNPDDGTLLYWDVSSIAASSIVQAASITLNVNGTTAHSYPLYEVLRSWNESQATWLLAATGSPWAVAGANGIGSDRGLASLGAVTTAVTGIRTFPLNADGVAAVQRWVSDPTRNFGLLLANYDTATDDLVVASSENSTKTKRPQLTIQYVANRAPLVNAGPDLNARATEPVLLDTLVYDDGLPAPAALTINWSTVSGPGPVAFDDPTISAPAVTFNVMGTYVLRETASDGALTSSDEVTITVGPPPNRPPVANAGGPYVVPEGSTATLDGTGTTDPDEPSAGLVYAWDLDYDGQTFNADASGSRPTVQYAENFAPRTIALSVTDSGGLTALATTTLQVANAPPQVSIVGLPSGGVEGTPISASSTVVDPGTSDTASYAWTVTKNGAPYATASSPTLSFTPNDNGAYAVTLAVTDDDGGVGTATATVTVANVPPTVTILGIPDFIGTPATVNLSAQTSDEGTADVQFHLWSVTLNGQPLVHGTAPTLSFTAPSEGLYAVSLTVIDDDNAAASDLRTFNGAGAGGSSLAALSMELPRLNAAGVDRVMAEASDD
jgi:hypothetical protein